MQELLELRSLIEQARYAEALTLLGEDEVIDDVYDDALGLASLEAFEGRYDPPELGEMVDKAQVKEQALRLILEAQ